MSLPIRVLVGLFLLGCTEPRPRARLADVLPTIPLPPGAEVINSEGSEDALKIRLRAAAAPEPLATYYRDLLSRAPWRLVSDAPTADGGIALYAERDSAPSIWITIRKADGAAGTFVDIAGAKAR